MKKIYFLLNLLSLLSLSVEAQQIIKYEPPKESQTEEVMADTLPMEIVHGTWTLGKNSQGQKCTLVFNPDNTYVFTEGDKVVKGNWLFNPNIMNLSLSLSEFNEKQFQVTVVTLKELRLEEFNDYLSQSSFTGTWHKK
jgi:hypothetical protein